MGITIGKNNGELYQPQSESGGSNLLPNLPEFRRSPFFLVHYPWSWEHHPEHGFIPTITRLQVVAGVNGTRGDKGQKPNPRLAVAGTVEKGGILFKSGDPRLGKWKDYMFSLKVDRGTAQPGKHFIWMGEQVEKLANGRAEPVDSSHAEGGWWEFVIYMRDESGAIPGMPGATFNTLRNRQEQRVTNMIERGRPQALVDAAKKTLDAMDAQWAEMNGARERHTATLGQTEDAMDLDGVHIPTPPKSSGRKRKTSIKGS